MVLIIILGILFFLALGTILYFVSVYNGLIVISRNIDKAWANIDVLLKQRYDEIPKLLKVCEGYMKYERETLEKITFARTACLQARTVGESAQAENQLSGALKTLFAVAENYPDLKANQNFMQLQQRVSYLESQIADRREFYNDSVNVYNIRIAQIPDMWVASMLKMAPKEFFKIAEEERKDVDIKFNFPK
ncbi:MAG: LemA family protein [Candidatus Omnitrophica bacterium CG07_land_8_20_14_0_80_42_15]|uniref:LemA family protein n=1 Tax=Candidatus Aquitaenariimonas noxiae TaxID=1974741 RepID=A0A2J0KXL7_9BACT|nr:MAG: LemA family protein [Candidatus Omnitrophica bacterium CG07_land_8_20_14_0_80_42_15]